MMVTLILEGNMRIERIVVLLLLATFSFTTSSALAMTKHWFVIKDKHGVCKVIKTKNKTHATVAGPFKTKRAALASKAKVCEGAIPSHKTTKKSIRPGTSSQMGTHQTTPGQLGAPTVK
jgi:hypothetical protein